MRRGAQGRFRIVARGEMWCDAAAFFTDDTLTVFEGEAGAERKVFRNTWRFAAPRDHV
jgi:hypothetical protein